jgi:small GTP-binding protein
MLSLQTRLFRVITIGDTSVGKTSIISQLVHNRFSPDQQSTVGAMFVLHVEIVREQRIEMQVWDTAGQERFRALGPIYYRNAAAAIAVFDLTNQTSFQRLDDWIGAFLGTAGDQALVCVVGNKADLPGDFAVEEERVQQWAEEHHYLYGKTSAKTGEGVQEVFRRVAEALMEPQVGRPPPELSTVDEKETGKGCC